MNGVRGKWHVLRNLLAPLLWGSVLLALALSTGTEAVGQTRSGQTQMLAQAEGQSDLVWPDPDANGAKRGEAPPVPADVSHHEEVRGDPTLATAAGVASSTPVDPLVEQIAAALNNDRLAIYNYIKTEIAFEPIYGLLRDPHRTILERAGTDADQALLLAELLKAAGANAGFMYGTVTLPLDLAASLVRVEDGSTVYDTCNRVFRAFVFGGVPVSNIQPCGNNVTREFTVQHVWVAAEVGGVVYELDPSVKHYQGIAGIDLGAAMGYDRPTFIGRAEGGATITPEKVDNLNEANISEDLEQYSGNLVAYIEALDQTNGRRSYLRDIVGGWELAEPPVAELPTTLPYPSTVAATFSDFDAPDSDPSAPELRHRVTVNVLEFGLPVIAYDSTLPELAGRRLTYQFSFFGLFFSQGTLRLEGSVIGSYLSLSTSQLVEFCVDAPFPAFGGSYGDECTQRALYASYAPHNLYAFVTEVGRAPESLLAERRAVLAANQQAFAPDSEPVIGETLYTLGLAWFNENGASERLHEAIARINGFRFHGLAVMAQEEFVDVSFGIDVRLNFVHFYSPTANAEDEGVFFKAAVAQGSGIEHAFIEQLQAREGISTVRALEIANGTPLGDGTTMPIFLGTPANWGTVRPQLCYDGGTLADLDAAIGDGWSVVVPQCTVALDCWEGTGWAAFASGGEAYIIRGGLNPVCTSGSAVSGASGAFDRGIAGNLGGSPTTEGPTDPNGAQCFLCKIIDFIFGILPAEAAQEGDPVDTQTGALRLVETDVSMAGSPPSSVESFERFYNSGTALTFGRFGNGWRNAYRWRLDIHSAYSRGLEGPDAVEVARLIAQVFVVQGLIRDGTIPEHEKRTIQAIATNWGMARLTNNAFALVGPDGSNGTFVELPGGRFSRSARLPWDLIKNPDGSITLDGREGQSLHFEKVDFAGGSLWRLVTWQDANGNTLTVTYDAPGPEGKIVQVIDSVGRTLTFAYTGDFVTQVTDPAGRVHAYGYDAAGNLVTHTDPRGTLTPGDPNDFVTTYAYDTAHRLTSITDPLGQTYLTNVYDAAGRVTQQTDGRGNVTLFYYGDHLTRIQDPLSHSRVVAWNDDGRQQRVTDEAGFVTMSNYDARGNLIKLEEPEGATSTFQYDLLDNLTDSTDPLANTTHFEYDADSRPALIRDPLGHETSFVYDAEGNLQSTTNALGQTTTFGYDAAGRLTDIFEPLTSAHTQMTYDAFGNLATTTNAELETTTFVSDIVGQLRSVTDPLGNVRSFEYDATGNLMKVTDPLGHFSTFDYNGNNLVTRVTDPKGRVTQNAHDAMNNLTLITRPDTTAIGFEYDTNNRLFKVIDPRNNPWTVERDPRGLVSAEIDPLGNRREFQYDGLQRLEKRTDAENRVTDYVWDPASRLKDILYDDATAVHNTYDADGLLRTSSFKDWNAEYQYDALHRVTVEDYPYLGRRVEHAWDQLGLEQSTGDRVKLALKVGADTKTAVTYAYDNAHRLDLMTDETGVSDYNYDAAGRLTRTALPNGASIEQTYDQASRILSVINKASGGDPFATFEYFDGAPSSPFYDDADNVTGVTHTTPQASMTTRYVYDKNPASPLDDLDRLLQEQTPQATTTYTYDAAGNRLSRTDAAGTTNYAYDAANQLLSAGPGDQSVSPGPTTYTYDRNGNLRSKTTPGVGTTTFAWDHENRLAGITPPTGPAVTFAYDPVGRQVLRQEAGGPAVHSTYDGLRLIAEGPANLSSGFVYGGGLRRMEHRRDLAGAATATGYAVDRLGSVWNLTDSTGAPRDAYRYDAFGGEALAAGLDSNAFRFDGSFGTEREPSAPALVRMGFRYYDAEAGRFVSRDPIRFLGADVNLYAFTGNNPATYSDPNGLERSTSLNRVWLDTLMSSDEPLLTRIGKATMDATVFAFCGRYCGNYRVYHLGDPIEHWYDLTSAIHDLYCAAHDCFSPLNNLFDPETGVVNIIGLSGVVGGTIDNLIVRPLMEFLDEPGP